MLKTRILPMALLGALASVVLPAAAAVAQDYPTRPVKLMVGFAPGSTIDLVARVLADGLNQRLKQPFIVENKSGGGGMIATEDVARAAGDGYTLLVSSTGTITVNPFIYPDIGYNVEKDFAPVTKVVQYPFILVINPEGPKTKSVKSLDDLVKLAKSMPGKLTYGSAGVGNLAHFAAAQMDAALGTETLHVPFRGAAPVLAALLAGEIDFMFAPLVAIPQIKAGKLLALGVTAKERWQDLPNVPAIVTELKQPALDISLWTGVLAPSKTPAKLVDFLHKEIAAVATTAPYHDALLQQGAIATHGPAAFSADIKSEMKQNAAIVKRLDIKPQ